MSLNKATSAATKLARVEPESNDGKPLSRAERRRQNWPWFLGKWATPADLKRTFWDESRVKHDPAERDSKDWDESEPDPTAP